MPSEHWAEALTDYGFNASPVWVMTGGGAAELFSAESLPQLVILAWLDVILMAVAFFFLFRAFGLRVLAFAVFLFGLNFTHRYEHMSGSLLRLDWLAMLVTALALLKMRRGNMAGVLLGWATMLRVFPALFLVGIAVLGLARIYRGESYFNRDTRTILFAIGTAAILFVGSLSMPLGISAWSDFTHNIGYHTKRLCKIKQSGTLFLGIKSRKSYYLETLSKNSFQQRGRVKVSRLYIPEIFRRSHF